MKMFCPLGSSSFPLRECLEDQCAWWEDKEGKCCVPVFCDRLAGIDNFIVLSIFGPADEKEKGKG